MSEIYSEESNSSVLVLSLSARSPVPPTYNWTRMSTRKQEPWTSSNQRATRSNTYIEKPQTGCTLFSVLLPTFPGVGGAGVPEIKVTYIEVHFYLLNIYVIA